MNVDQVTEILPQCTLVIEILIYNTKLEHKDQDFDSVLCVND